MAIAAVGFGIGAALGIGLETTPGTPVAPDVWLPIVSESIAAQRAVIESSSITGDRSRRKLLEGLRTAAGNFQMEVDGSTMGLPLYCANGRHSGALTSANLAGYITATPTASAESGGSLAPGTYRYKVASVWQRTATGEKFELPGTAEVSGTSASSNNTVRLTFTDPTTLTPPTGFTYAGTAIYRTNVGGSTNTQVFLAYQSGTGATYDDTGSVNDGTTSLTSTKTIVVLGATARSHVFNRAFVTGSNPLPAFSTTVVKDNDYSQRFELGRMQGVTFNFASSEAPVTAEFEVLHRDFARIANPSPSLTNLRKMMSWAATLQIDGSANETIESFQIAIKNNGQPIPGFRGKPTNRDGGYGRRQCDLTFTRSFENHALWDKMRSAERFSLDAWVIGQPMVEQAVPLTISATETALAIPYMIRFEAPKLALSTAGANAGGPERMIESLNAMAEVDEGTGVDVRITVYNMTNTYG